MRQSLLGTFDQIHIFDLGGESGAPGDENVFDITKGVAIALLVKRRGAEKRVRYASTFGTRIEKYQLAASVQMGGLSWTELQPTTPNYFLVPRTELGRQEYEGFHRVSDIFPVGSTGILTARDSIARAASAAEMVSNLQILVGSSPDDEVVRHFGLGKWSPTGARATLRKEGIAAELVRPLAYRPFDVGAYYDHNEIVFRRRDAVMRHMREGNVGLAVCRLTKGGPWAHTLVAGAPTDDSFVSDASKERAYLYPLLLDNGGTVRSWAENLSPDFRSFIDVKYSHHYSPEEILGYIYAILHAPIYRRRYAEFLRIDFPRIPFVDSQSDFDELSALGWTVVEAHLLRRYPRRRLADFHGKGTQAVEFVRYAEFDNTIAINNTQRFGPVPEDIWNFHIGGYQVLDKYLKSRKGRVLSLDEINQVSAVADSLAFTVEQMAEIDRVYQRVFPEAG